MENIKGREYSSEDIQDIPVDLPDDYGDQVYSPRELEQLGKFTHIHESIDQVEENLSKGLGYFSNMKEGEKPKKENLIFMMDSRLNWYLHIIAYNMYKELSGNEKMREAVEGYLIERHNQKQVGREFEIAELNHLFDVE